MNIQQTAVEDLGDVQDVGFYFKHLGGVAFGKLSAAFEAPGATAMVTASSKHGLIFFSDLSGVYALQTSDLLPKLSTSVGREGYVPPKPADVCLWHKPLLGITQLALSADDTVLAAVDGPAGTIRFFPLADMRLPGKSSPHWSLQLTGIRQFCWCKSATQHVSTGAGPNVFLAVTADRSLRLGRYGDAKSSVVVATSRVECADWCPAADGSSEVSPAFAYSTGGELVIASIAGGAGTSLAVRELARLPLKHPQEPNVVFESVRWVLPNAMLLGGTELVGNSEDAAEGDDEYSCLLTLHGWAANAEAGPQGATLYADQPRFVEESSTPRLAGPYLHAVAVPRWGAVVRCHRKAVDDHIRLTRTPEGEFGSGGSPEAVDVTETNMMMGVPNGPDGGNNFVLGLGFDTSLPLEPMVNPSSPEKPLLVPPPVLLLVTSDGALRLYAFGHVDLTAPLRPGAATVVPLPLKPPEWAAFFVAGPVRKASPDRLLNQEEVEQQQREVESDSESGEEVTSPGVVGSLAPQPAAKQQTLSALPSGVSGSGCVAFPAMSASTAAASSFEAAVTGATGLAKGTSSATADGSSSTAGAQNFGFGFGFGTPAGNPTSAPTLSMGVGGGMFGTATSANSFGGLFGQAGSTGLQGAAGGKDSRAVEVLAGAATSAGSLFCTPATGPAGDGKAPLAPAAGSSAFGEGSASSPASGFGNLNLGALPTPQLPFSASTFGSGGGGGLFAPPVRLLSSPAATDGFIPSASFTGPTPGFMFTTREGVTGFYKDKVSPSPAAIPEASARPAPAPAQPQPVAGRKAALAPAKKVPEVNILRPAVNAAAGSATQPSGLASPDVPAPKAQLAGESKEAASAEASFLRELHEVRRKAAKLDLVMKDIAAGCPDACGGREKGGYKAVATRVEALARRAAALHAQYERANKRVAGLFDGLGSLQGRLDALQLFSGGGASGPGPAPATIAALEANLPLEPALDALRRDVMTRLEALSTCLDELEDVLDAWEAPQGGNQATPARLSTSVLYNTLASAGAALSGAANRILILAARLEELGACPAGFVGDPNGPMAGLLSWSKGSSCGVGGLSLSAGDGVAVVSRIPSADACASVAVAARTPDGKAAPSSATSDTLWHTPKSADGRRSPLLTAGTTSPSSQQQRTATPTQTSVNAFLSRLQAMARVGGKVRVTSAVCPPAPAEPPGAALLQMVLAAEAARDALPEAPEPASPPRAQVKPLHLISTDPAAGDGDTGGGGGGGAAAAPKAAAVTKLSAPTGIFGSTPPPALQQTTPSLAPLGAAKPAAEVAKAQAAGTSQQKASQPPVPTMSQVQAARKLQAQSGGNAGSAGASAQAATGKTAAAAAKPSGGGQPPVPSMALFAQAAQLQQKAAAQQVVPPARPTDSGSSANSTATSKPQSSKAPAAVAPPVPSAESMRAAAAAQVRAQQQQAQQQQQQAQKQQQAPLFGGLAVSAQPVASITTGSQGSGFGLSSTGLNVLGSASAPAGTAGAPATAAAAAAKLPGSDAGATVAPVASGGPTFGFGALSFGAPAARTAPTTSGSSTAGGGSMFNLATSTSGPGAKGGLFGTFVQAPASEAAVSPPSQAAPSTGTALTGSQSTQAAASAPMGMFSTLSASTTAPATGTAGAGNTVSMFGGLSFGGTSSSGPAAPTGSSSPGNAGSPSPFGTFGTAAQPNAAATPGGAASAPDAATSPFGAFASSAAASSAAAGASGFNVFSSSPAGGAAQPSAPAATSSTFGGGAAPTSSFSAGPFGVQSAAAMPTVQTGIFSSFGQSPAFGSPATAVAAPFGSQASLGGGGPSAFGSVSPAAPAAPAFGSSTFGSSSFGAPAAFGSPAPVGPAAPTAPFGSGFGQSSGFGFAAGGSAGQSPGGFGAFASSAPTPPAPAGGGFAAFANQGGGFGGFGASAGQQPTQGGGFGMAGGGGFGHFVGGGIGASQSASTSADLWKPRK